MEIIARVYTDFPEKFGILAERPRGRSGRRGWCSSPPIARPDGGCAGWRAFPTSGCSGSFRSPCERWSLMRPPRLGRQCAHGRVRHARPPQSHWPSCVRLEGIDYGGKDGPICACAARTCSTARPSTISSLTCPRDSHRVRLRWLRRSRARARPARGVPGSASASRSRARPRSSCGAAFAGPAPALPARPPERLYGLPFAGVNVRFTVDGDTPTVREVGEQQGRLTIKVMGKKKISSRRMGQVFTNPRLDTSAGVNVRKARKAR